MTHCDVSQHSESHEETLPTLHLPHKLHIYLTQHSDVQKSSWLLIIVCCVLSSNSSSTQLGTVLY